MSAPTFGVQFKHTTSLSSSILGADFSKVIAIETSEDAIELEFPLNTAVRFSTSDSVKLSKLGTGLLYDYVKGVHDQLDGLNAGVDMIVVRVKEEAEIAATVANIVAVVNQLPTIPAGVKATPRIVLAGRTAWRPEDTENPGQFLASPVVAALQTVLGKIYAIAPADVDDASMLAAIEARETMSSKRVMPIGVAVKVQKGTETVTVPASPYVAGLFVRIDNNENEGKPFEPIANRPIYGIVGLSRDIPFSIFDGSTEGQQMLAANVSIIVDGEVGVDGAIADGGYHFIGTDNALDNADDWEQIHQVRGADYLELKMASNWKKHGGRKITVDRVENWLTANARMLRDHKVDNDILGYTPLADMFKKAKNSPEEVGLGTLTTTIGIEPAPVFKLGNHEIERYRPALEGLVDDVIARLSTAA